MQRESETEKTCMMVYLCGRAGMRTGRAAIVGCNDVKMLGSVRSAEKSQLLTPVAGTHFMQGSTISARLEPCVGAQTLVAWTDLIERRYSESGGNEERG